MHILWNFMYADRIYGFLIILLRFFCDIKKGFVFKCSVDDKYLWEWPLHDRSQESMFTNMSNNILLPVKISQNLMKNTKIQIHDRE